MEYSPFDIKPLHYRDHLCMTLGDANWEELAQVMVIRSQLKGKWASLTLADFPGELSLDSTRHTLDEMICAGYVLHDRDADRYSLTPQGMKTIIEGGFASDNYKKNHRR